MTNQRKHSESYNPFSLNWNEFDSSIHFLHQINLNFTQWNEVNHFAKGMTQINSSIRFSFFISFPKRMVIEWIDLNYFSLIKQFNWRKEENIATAITHLRSIEMNLIHSLNNKLFHEWSKLISFHSLEWN